MESYPVEIDLDPEQVVRWLMVERERGGSGLQVSAWRVNERHSIEPGVEEGLGDEEREDLSDETTVARLEITPIHGSEGWRMVISVEAELEPLVPGEDVEDEDQESIDLDTFYLDFIRSGHGVASIAAEVESAEAEAHLDRLVDAIEANCHVPEVRRSKTGRAARAKRGQFKTSTG